MDQWQLRATWAHGFPWAFALFWIFTSSPLTRKQRTAVWHRQGTCSQSSWGTSALCAAAASSVSWAPTHFFGALIPFASWPERPIRPIHTNPGNPKNLKVRQERISPTIPSFSIFLHLCFESYEELIDGSKPLCAVMKNCNNRIKTAFAEKIEYAKWPKVPGQHTGHQHNNITQKIMR